MTWGNQNTESEAHAQMDYALDQGIDFFDTAELYAVPPSAETQGLTEKYIGTWFKDRGTRSKVMLASKVAGPGLPWIRGSEKLSRAAMDRAIEGSLKRLQTDYIDLYQIHWPNRPTYRMANYGVNWHATDYAAEKATIVECLEAADALVKAGKIRYLGLSNDTAWGVMTFLNEAERRQLPRIVSVQNEYSLMCRWYDKDLAEIHAAEGVGLLGYSALVAGSISGKYLNGARPIGARWSIDNRVNHRDTAAAHAATRAYMDVAKKHGLDVCQMALAWAMTRPFMTSVILGATSLETLKADIAAKDLKLSPECMADIEATYRQHPMPF